MTEKEIFLKLKEIFKLVINQNARLEAIERNSLIMSDLGISSVGLIYLVIAIEESFEIDMSEVTFNTFRNVQDVINYILEKRG